MEKENKGRNLGELIEHLEGIYKEEGNTLSLLVNGKELDDFTDIIDVDYTANELNICTVNTLFNSMELDYEIQHKAFIALCRCINEYGWDIYKLHLDEGIAYAEVREETTIVSKNYNEELDTWE